MYLKLILQYDRLSTKKKREKADECAITFTYPQFCCEIEDGGEAYDRNRFTINNLFIILWNDNINYHKRCLNYCNSNINN